MTATNRYAAPLGTPRPLVPVPGSCRAGPGQARDRGDPAVHPFFPCPGQSRSQGRNGAGADLHCAARRYMTRPLYRRALVGRLACKAGPGAVRGKTVPPQGGGDNNAFCAGSEETL